MGVKLLLNSASGFALASLSNYFMHQLRLKIYGNVQGVGFRYWARNQAKALGLAGFCRNEADGTVTILAQGKQKDLDKFLKMCYDGPSFAQITHVTPEWEEAGEHFKTFEIL
ncbi:MAG: acylphosphatase [Candidatus Portnoybacteria bacterium]|nr:acylphosphatase [Candidatus Portnoybacteria bacterium]